MGYTQGLRWQQAYDDLTDHVATTGGYPRPRAKVIGSRCRRDLVAWINEQRRLHRAGRLHPERVRQLEALPGWTWTPLADAWQDAYTDTVGHINRTGRYPSQHTASRGQRSGIDLGQWLKWQRLHHRRGTLPADRARQLEALPAWTWGRTRSGR